jgi:hypothetical protein
MAHPPQPPPQTHNTPPSTPPHRDTAAPGPDAHRMTSTTTPPDTQRKDTRDGPQHSNSRQRLHDRMEHKPAAVMCRAVNTTRCNAGVTPSDIGRVFYRQPCLTCILAMRNRDSKLIWARKRPPPQPPPGEHSQPDASTPATTASDPEEADCEIGEVVSYDNVGPINPASLEGYTQFLVFRDTRSKYIFA